MYSLHIHSTQVQIIGEGIACIILIVSIRLKRTVQTGIENQIIGYYVLAILFRDDGVYREEDYVEISSGDLRTVSKLFDDLVEALEIPEI